jgi:ketosteroid isomerase-like protein
MSADIPVTGDVPAAIRRFVDTTNAGDHDGFVETFTQDALLSDWGREFRGREAIAEWDETDNIGRKSRFELLEVRRGDTEHEFVATVVVTGGGFNGTSDLAFTVRGDEVARLEITP